MADRSIVNEWISKGEEDYRFARINLEQGRDFFPQICFHFQQAAEKYLKSFIVAFNLEFRKVHDLGLLLKVCSSVDASLEELKEDCEFLSAFYGEARYPVHWPTNFSREETEKALQAADRIRLTIRSKLNADILR
jgi:HEPN domain-containing protein